MPFVRHLSQEFVGALLANPFWVNACADRQVQPEIRNNKVTIYSYGQALIRELRLSKGVLNATVHHKFVPLQRVNPLKYLTVAWNVANGFAFQKQLQAQSLQHGDAETLRAYKRLMKFEAGPEDLLQQRIIIQPQNLVIDQQIEFSGGRSNKTNKIDLCYYDPSIKRIVFAEIKRKEDLRLFGPGDEPEVINQLHAYSEAIRQEQQAILDGLTTVIRLKRALGLQNRLNGIPEEGLQLERKPLLIIGNCTDQEVRQIFHAGRNREIPSPWSRLWNHLEQAACGLIACGELGCSLSIRGHGGQRRWFGQ